MTYTIIEQAKDFANLAHNSVNQTYMGAPYILHLRLAQNVAERYINGYTEEVFKENLLAAVWLHDTLEDCHHVSYNTLKSSFNIKIANLVYAVTDKKGRNRKERKDFESILATKGATFVKLCDRIANVEAGIIFKGDQLEMYRKEQFNFALQLYPQDGDEVLERMFYDLDVILNPEISLLIHHFTDRF